MLAKSSSMLAIFLLGVLFISCKAQTSFFSTHTLPTPVEVDSTTPPTAGIINGDVLLDPTAYPWMVFIDLDNGDNQCGGTLISDQWILTAAHCFDEGREPTGIFLGTTRKRGIDGVEIKASLRCCHEEYNMETLDNDICLLKINESSERPPFVRPLLLPAPDTQIKPGTECTILGWGYDENQNLPDNLLEARVKIIERETCKKWHVPNQITVVNYTICAGHESGGSDTCGGDSGGPLVCYDKHPMGELQGITSYGPFDCGGEKSPGIYTKVTDFMDWIIKTMNKPCLQYHWGEWNGVCPVTCGRGIEQRSRSCLDEQNKETDVSNCHGSSEAIQFCNLAECPVYHWGAWQQSCSVTCGEGTETGVRTCLDEGNYTVSSHLCSGIEEFRQPCKLGDCPVYHWGVWIRSCSVTCGEGIESGVRICLDEDNSAVSSDLCSGVAESLEVCKLQECPTPSKYSWGSWNTHCSVTCGSGIQTRSRSCLDDTGFVVRKRRCGPGNAYEVGSCQLGSSCPVSEYSWSAWSPWTECETGLSGDPCQGLKYATRACTRNGMEAELELCSDQPDYYRQTSCSTENCDNPSPIFNFEDWTRNVLNGRRR